MDKSNEVEQIRDQVNEIDQVRDEYVEEYELEHDDPLLECLVIITKIKHNPFSSQALRVGLPLVNHRLSPDIFPRSAARAGFIAKLKKRPLKKISALVLPAILLLRGGRACVLRQCSKKNQYEVTFPEVGDGISTISYKELNSEYTGYVFFLQPIDEYEARSEQHMEQTKSPSWFWGTLWRFKHYYMQVMLATVFINLFALAVPLFTMNVYDRVVPNNTMETLWALSVGVIIIFLFDFLLRTLRGYFIDLAGKKVDLILASTLFEQALGVKLEARPISTGVYANHLRDYENIRDFFTSATIAAIADLPFIALFVVVIWLIGGLSIASIPAIGVLIGIVSAVIVSLPLHKVMTKSFQGSAQKHAVLVESLNNLDAIKSVSAEGTMQERWERFVNIAADASIATRFWSSLAVNISTFIYYAVMIAVVILGVYQIEAKNLTVGGLIACTILAGRAVSPLIQITSLLTRYQLAKLSLGVLNSMMELPQERPKKHKFLHRPKFNGNIEFSSVNFSYPEQQVGLLKNISFQVKPGEKVAILGSMGSGKTTLLKLIMGFYEVGNGSIRIDGTEIGQVDPADLRRYIGYVQQEPKLFYGTVRDNIAVKAPWIGDDEILACAKLATADSFIRLHPSGYDMPIGEAGVGLSGGQCQAIAIARSLVLSPSILLLDEPTSAMDNNSEQQFLMNMKEYAQDRTLILVTHKMAMLALVDRIIILQAGQIVADDEKEQVLASLRELNK